MIVIEIFRYPIILRVIGGHSRGVQAHDLDCANKRDFGTSSKDHALAETTLIIDRNQRQSSEIPGLECAFHPTENFSYLALNIFVTHGAPAADAARIFCNRPRPPPPPAG